MVDFIENEGVEYPEKTQTEEVAEQTTETQAEAQAEETATDIELVDDKPKEEVKAEETQPEDDLIILPETEEPAEVSESTVSELSEVFGSDFKSKEEAKQYFESLKAENENLKKQSESVFANENVKALNEYMKNGGAEEKEFLDTKYNQSKITQAIEQVKKIDPLAIVREDLKVNHGLSEEEIETYMATESEVKLKIEGNKLKNEYLNQLDSSLKESQKQEADMIKSAQEKQIKFTERIKSYVSDIKEVNGVQVSDTDKKILLKDLASPGDFIRKYFPLDKDGLPTKDWVTNASKFLTHTKLVNHVKNKVSSAKAEGVKQAFSELHNIPKQEASAQKAVSEKVESEAEVILKNLQKKESAKHYN